jgi:amino acid transporter
MMAITGPAEISAAATLINFWEHDINAAVWYSVFIVVLVAMCFCGARVYGEVRTLCDLVLRSACD